MKWLWWSGSIRFSIYRIEEGYKRIWKCIMLQKQLWNHLVFVTTSSLLLSRPLTYSGEELFCLKQQQKISYECCLLRAKTVFLADITPIIISSSNIRISIPMCPFRGVLTFLLVDNKVTVWIQNVSVTLKYTWNRMENAKLCAIKPNQLSEGVSLWWCCCWHDVPLFSSCMSTLMVFSFKLFLNCLLTG